MKTLFQNNIDNLGWNCSTLTITIAITTIIISLIFATGRYITTK